MSPSSIHPPRVRRSSPRSDRHSSRPTMMCAASPRRSQGEDGGDLRRRRCRERPRRGHRARRTRKAPIGHSFRGKQWIQYDNPFDVGMTGLLGYGAAHAGDHDADLLVLSAPTSRTSVPAHARRTSPRSIRSHAPRPSHGVTHPACTVTSARRSRGLAARGAEERPQVPRQDAEEAPKLLDTVVGAYTDVEHRARSIPSTRSASSTTPPPTTRSSRPIPAWATSGGALHDAHAPASHHRLIPARLDGQRGPARARRAGRVPRAAGVAIAGDGGLSMLLGELIAAVAYDLPIKVFVFNNSTLGLVKLEMLVDGFPSFGVESPESTTGQSGRLSVCMPSASRILASSRSRSTPRSRTPARHSSTSSPILAPCRSRRQSPASRSRASPSRCRRPCCMADRRRPSRWRARTSGTCRGSEDLCQERHDERPGGFLTKPPGRIAAQASCASPDQRAVYPPSTTSSEPVMNEARRSRRTG